jgi:hypothetical protein
MFLCISSIFMRFMEPAVLFKPVEINENSIFFRFFTTKTFTSFKPTKVLIVLPTVQTTKHQLDSQSQGRTHLAHD